MVNAAGPQTHVSMTTEDATTERSASGLVWESGSVAVGLTTREMDLLVTELSWR